MKPYNDFDIERSIAGVYPLVETILTLKTSVQSQYSLAHQIKWANILSSSVVQHTTQYIYFEVFIPPNFAICSSILFVPKKRPSELLQ